MIKAMSSTSCLGKPNTTRETQKRVHMDDDNGGDARVSSKAQKGDLERQVDDLQRTHPTYKVIQDIGSGLNWKRPGFTSLLESIHQGDIETVVVMHRDRLARFGVELIEWILRKNGTQLLVQSHPNETEGNDRGEEAELVDDMLSIVNVFVARNNGRRSAANRKRRSQSSKAGEGRGKEYSRYDEVSIVSHS